jgi:hypothetical protein
VASALTNNNTLLGTGRYPIAWPATLRKHSHFLDHNGLELESWLKCNVLRGMLNTLSHVLARFIMHFSSHGSYLMPAILQPFSSSDDSHCNKLNWC